MVRAGHVPLDRIGKVRWVDALDLFAFLRRHPTMDDLMAAWTGFKPPGEDTPPTSLDAADPSGIGAMIAQNPSGFVTANRQG